MLLSVLLIIQTVYLLYYKNQIKDIGNQLSFISKNNSFKFIHTQLKPQEIHRLTTLCNTLLSNQRDLNQKFIKKNNEVNATIVNLSHDIRTPLTSLDGYLQLAKLSQLNEEKTKYIAKAQDRIKQITTLVDELFLYTKLQNQVYVLELHSIDMINVLQKHLFSFIDEFSKIGHEPILNLPESPIYALSNEGALERVWENIIRNYFLHGEGTLAIDCEENQEEIVFQFSNRLKANQSLNPDKVFSRFYKEDPSRTKHSSGLGLSIVKSLVEMMHGTVHAKLDSNEFCLSVTFNKHAKENEHGR